MSLIDNLKEVGRVMLGIPNGDARITEKEEQAQVLVERQERLDRQWEALHTHIGVVRREPRDHL